MSPEEASTRTTADETTGGFTEAERAAMKERSKELRAAKRGKKADPEADVLAKIAEMSEPDRSLAERLHALVKEHAPSLTPRTWYGMPAYARDGKVLCFFQASEKFGARYATLGFNDVAALDDGTMWPTAFALTARTPENEARISELLRKAVG
ncbi:MAG: DUF1801 domain-containing protein [Thermomicrobiales bacterium]|nr:DUF1801 domain-containing protein [Chloroflexia bacterium]